MDKVIDFINVLKKNNAVIREERSKLSDRCSKLNARYRKMALKLGFIIPDVYVSLDHFFSKKGTDDLFFLVDDNEQTVSVNGEFRDIQVITLFSMKTGNLVEIVGIFFKDEYEQREEIVDKYTVNQLRKIYRENQNEKKKHLESQRIAESVKESIRVMKESVRVAKSFGYEEKEEEE